MPKYVRVARGRDGMETIKDLVLDMLKSVHNAKAEKGMG